MVHEVRMPVLSQSMIQGRVVEWLLKEGEKVDKGALLVVVESDKATHELEAAEAGILDKILVEEGAEVDVDTVLALIAEADGQVTTQEPPRSSPAFQAASTTPITAPPSADESRPRSPRYKELGVDLA
jgi:pyruvate/2-oxoglutarate dehydrogenase complex dihydrolipoamide acyltransferase (E2) component